MLSIKDVVSLAKAGYKPADVKELMEMSMVLLIQQNYMEKQLLM